MADPAGQFSAGLEKEPTEENEEKKRFNEEVRGLRKKIEKSPAQEQAN
jgi:hypothetical protein